VQRSNILDGYRRIGLDDEVDGDPDEERDERHEKNHVSCSAAAFDCHIVL
jgi:hypothetical protein